MRTLLNQLAKQFNQALMHAKQGTKDLAFIQLRRILSSYPHFVKGYLLLALLYMENGNTDKAKKALKRVLRIDKNNTLAVKYLASPNKLRALIFCLLYFNAKFNASIAPVRSLTLALMRTM